ncbi:hypothetical protein [Nostoc sp.]
MPDGVIGAMSMTGYEALFETLFAIAIGVAFSVADTNRIYAKDIP